MTKLVIRLIHNETLQNLGATMPDVNLTSPIQLLHAIPELYAVGRTALDIIQVNENDRDPAKRMKRRFALARGGKYFCNKMEGLKSEVLNSITKIPGLASSDLQPFRCFRFSVQGTHKVLSVVLAIAENECREAFTQEYFVTPESTTLSGASESNSILNSHQVSTQIDLSIYAGIEYPSVRFPEANNYLLHSPEVVVDFDNSNQEPLVFA